MSQQILSDSNMRGEEKQNARTRATARKIPLMVGLMLRFVLWAHFASGVRVFHSESTAESGWDKFRADYGIAYFGDDGQFVRAVQNGYNLVITPTNTRRALRARPPPTARTPAPRAIRPKISPTASLIRTAWIRRLASGFLSKTAFDGAMRMAWKASCRQSMIPQSAISACWRARLHIICNSTKARYASNNHPCRRSAGKLAKIVRAAAGARRASTCSPSKS